MIASSKVMTTSTDPPRQQQQKQPPPLSSSSVAGAPPTLCPSFSGLLADLQNPSDLSNQQSMSMDDILKNIYSSTTTMPAAAAEQVAFADASLTRAESRSVKEVWDEIVTGGAGGGSDQVRVGAGGDEEITLEAFLTKAGAVTEEDVGVYGNNNNNIVNNNTGNVSNISTNGNNGVGVGVGRGKRRVVEAPPVDKATQQKQRRMIKNRESAARSRERKQAYTVELESLVTQLEEENARLLREEAEQNKERYKQLMENLIPVVDKKRSPRVLRRVQSSLW